MERQKNIPKLRFPTFNGEWQKQKLSDIILRVTKGVEVVPEEYYQQIGIRSHGKGIFHKDEIKGRELGNKRVFWIVENAFIVNIVFAWEHAVAKTTMQEVGMIASHRFPMYIPKESKSSVDYLLHFFLTPKGKTLLELASPGGAGRNKTLGQTEFLKLAFHLPTTLEQQKIASFFTAIDQKISQLKQKKNLLEEYKKGVMQKIFSQEPEERGSRTPAKNNKVCEQIRFKDDNGQEFPKWEKKRLGEIGETYNGLTGKSKEDFGEGLPYIQYKQIFDDSKIDISRFDFVKIEREETQKRVIFGDVFFTVSSETPNEIGTASVLLNEVEELYLNSFCFGYRSSSQLLSPYYSRYLFRNELFRKDIVKLAQGSTRYNMSKVQLLKLEVLIPSLPEQLKIADFLSAIDDKINHTQKQIEKAEVWKKGLLQQMFV